MAGIYVSRIKHIKLDYDKVFVELKPLSLMHFIYCVFHRLILYI